MNSNRSWRAPLAALMLGTTFSLVATGVMEMLGLVA